MTKPLRRLFPGVDYLDINSKILLESGMIVFHSFVAPNLKNPWPGNS